MSNVKNNTFNKLLDYFAEDEEDSEEEEEIFNYEQQNKNIYYSKSKESNHKNIEQSKDIKNSLNNKEEQIFTELYSNIENNNDDNKIFHYEERKFPFSDIKGEDFNNFKIISFRPNDLDEDEKEIKDESNINKEEEKGKEKENIKENSKIIEKIDTNNCLINSKKEDNNNENNTKQSKKDILYNKIISGQCSFGNFNETSNRSTSINTDKIGEFQHSTFFQENIDQEMYKPEYLINSKSFDELENNNISNNNNYSQNNNTCSNTNTTNITDTNTYTFKHSKKDWINTEEKDFVKKHIEQLKKYMMQKSKPKNSKSKSKDKKNGSKRNTINYKSRINNSNNICKDNNKRPIELVLYDDAVKKKEKMENINKNNMTEIKLNSTNAKINKKSYQIALEHDDKKIEDIVNRYSNHKKERLSIIHIALIFQDLKIFRKLLQNINVNKLENIGNINEFINRISIAIKDGEIRKNEELKFLEQTWNMLNPDQKSTTIRKDIFEGLLKIIFSPVWNASYVSNILNQYLQAALFGEGIVPLSNRNKKDLKNYIKTFFKLKENMIAYKNINNYNDKNYEKIIKERDKNLTFEPNIPKTENYRTTITERKKNFNFNSLYNRFIQKEKNKQSNLKKFKQDKMKEELKELKQKPTISKYSDNNFYQDDNNPQNIHDKLYKMDKELRQKRQNKIDAKKREEEKELERELKSFKLNVNYKENRKRMAKSFDNKKKPKGYDDYIIRNKKAILERKRIKTLMEKVPCGENYEKIKKRSITPFNITDMRKKKERIENLRNDEFFTLQIKIPNGQLRTLKIYIKSDPYKVADDFCKIYSIKESVKKKLIKNIIDCQKAYLNNKKNKEMEEEEEVEEEGEEINNNKEISGYINNENITNPF